MIVLNNLSKEFKQPVRGKGFFGMFKTLFSRKYTVSKAVNSISFTVNDGESVGYIGANGAGKSTTIKMMCGILTPSYGDLTIDGLKPYNQKSRSKVLKNIGVVFGQKTQLWSDLPLIETFSLLQSIYEIEKADFDERLKFLTEILDLNKFISQPVRTLSLGQRMRADLAAAMLHNPKILFLDEPTIGLDIIAKRNLIFAIKEMRQKYNTTLILTTHAMSDIEDLCERIIIIDEGKVIFDGKTTALKANYGDKRLVTFDTKSPINIEDVKEKLNSEGILSVETNLSFTTFNIDAGKLKLNDLLGYVMKNYEIVDIKITETGIEQIVAGIYESKHI